MSEEEKVTWTIGEDIYDPEDLSNGSRTHFIQAANLRNVLAELMQQQANTHELIINTKVALEFRENELRSSITVAEVLAEPELEAADG